MTPSEAKAMEHNIREQIKRAEGNIERRLNEHTQMQVMLERCFFCFNALGTFGGLHGAQAETVLRQAREIEALLKKVNTK